MKIAVVSDSHDRAPMLAAAVSEAKARGAAAIVHCGDVIGVNTLKPLRDLGLPLHLVHGNNIGDPLALANLHAASGGLFTYHGADAELLLGGRRLVATHYPLHGRGLACTGDYDLVCCGHSHEASVQALPNVKGGRTWLLNPGTVAGLGGPATWIFADLATMEFEIRPVPRYPNGQ